MLVYPAYGVDMRAYPDPHRGASGDCLGEAGGEPADVDSGGVVGDRPDIYAPVLLTD